MSRESCGVHVLNDPLGRFSINDGWDWVLHLVCDYPSCECPYFQQWRSKLNTFQIFFPRSITRESGYKAKANSAHSSNIPPSSPLPNYHHNRDPSSPKSVYTRNPVPEIRMSSFRFPDSSSPHPFHHLDNQSHPHAPRRNSTESELSPGYESDAESEALSSHLPSLHTMPSHLDSSQPSKSGAPSSDDTVWEREQELAALKRRRHSDGPFFYDRRENVVAPHLGTPAAQEAGRAQPSSSHLHPYVRPSAHLFWTLQSLIHIFPR
jgi:hypothetical protein